jgi:hypothetical protein
MTAALALDRFVRRERSWKTLWRAVPLACGLVAVLSSTAAGMAASGSVAADAPAYIRIDGATGGDASLSKIGGLAGTSVSGAGDVNGDGRPDVIVGAPFEDNNGRANSGSAYVVFGRPELGTIDLASLGDGGFRIDGARPGQLAGRAVAGAGDVNGDGRSDLIVGAPGLASATPSGEERKNVRGRAFVVFGRTGSSSLDLANLGGAGFEIDGRRSFYSDGFGLAVDGAGDVTGDGKADLVVAAPGNSGFEERFTRGGLYVIFGSGSSSVVKVGRLRRRGFKITVNRAGAALTVSGAGDVNGDRRADIVVGEPSARVRGQTRGAAYVVFGRRYRRALRLATLGRHGFRIEGAGRLDDAGASVAGAGRVNGDRRSDLVVGAPGNANAGAAYVVFGKSSTGPISLIQRPRRGITGLGRHGFAIVGRPGDFAGLSVAGLGRVDGDRRRDVGLFAGGSAFVVFGRAPGAAAKLAALGGHGFQLDGPSLEPSETPFFPGRGFGPVAGAGDWNGDGRADVLVGAPGAGHNGRYQSGSAYVFF